jgi:hypothetical protein
MSSIQYDPNSGTLKYALWEKQKEAVQEFEDANIDITDFRAGYRAGKSYLGARAIIKQAWDNNGTKWAVMADSYREGVRSTFEVLFENLPAYDGDNPESSPLVDNYHKQDMILTLTNDSKILLATAQKYDSLKGTELSGAWLDEVAFYSTLYDTLEMVLSRLSDDHNLGLLVTTTTNGYNDYYDICDERVHPETGNDHGWRVSTVQADVRDNPTISAQVKERLERTHKGNEQEGLIGGFAADEGRVYPSFARNSHVISGDVEIDGMYLYGMDFGWSDPTVVLQLGRLDNGDLIILDEFYASETELEEAQSFLNARPNAKVYVDHHPRQKKRMSDNTNNKYVDAEKNKDDGVMSVRQYINHDIDSSPDLYVHARCTNLINEIVGYTTDILRGKKSGDDHACDAMRYVLHTPSAHILHKNSSSKIVAYDDIDDDTSENIESENDGDVSGVVGDDIPSPEDSTGDYDPFNR